MYMKWESDGGNNTTLQTNAVNKLYKQIQHIHS